MRHWCAQSEARYEDLGRPTLWAPERSRNHTLDFTLRDRASGRTFVAEIKCELEFDNYRYLRLASADQLRHHTGAAFQAFLSVARAPGSYETLVHGRPLPIDGAVLVWGATTPAGCAAVSAECGFADVLSVEEMIRDLRAWDVASWRTRVAELREWSNVLFDYLV